MAGSNILRSYLIKLSTSFDRKGLDGFVDAVDAGTSKVDKLDNAVDKLDKTIINTSNSAQAGKERLDKFVGAIATGVSKLATLGTMAVAAFAVMRVGVTRTAGTQAELNDFAESVGTTAENIERMDYVARQLGGSSEAMRSSMEKVASIAGKAASGVPAASKAFSDLGIDVRNSNGELKDTVDLMAEIGNSVKGMSPGEQRFRLTTFGIDPGMVRALTEDTRELNAEFRKFSIAANIDFNKAAKSGASLTREMEKSKGFLGRIWTGISAELMGVTENSYKRLNKYIIENADRIGKFVKSASRSRRATSAWYFSPTAALTHGGRAAACSARLNFASMTFQTVSPWSAPGASPAS